MSSSSQELHQTTAWSDEQVAKLNEWQACGWVHPFTCPTAHSEGRSLVATRQGWICPYCDYRQAWAHDFMFHGAPPNPLAGLTEREAVGPDAVPGTNPEPPTPSHGEER